MPNVWKYCTKDTVCDLKTSYNPIFEHEKEQELHPNVHLTKNLGVNLNDDII